VVVATFASTLILAKIASLGSTQMNMQHRYPVAPATVSLAQQSRAVLLEAGTLLPPSLVIRAILDDSDSALRELSNEELRRLAILSSVTEIVGLDPIGPERWIDELSTKLPELRERLVILRRQDAAQFTVTKSSAPRWVANIGGMPQESQLNWSVPLTNPRLEKEFVRRAEADGVQAAVDCLPEWLTGKNGEEMLRSAWELHEFLGSIDATIRRVPRYVDRGDYSEAGSLYHDIAAKVFERLNTELGDPVDARGNGPLREATLRYALMAFSGAEKPVDDQLKKRLVAIAKLDLATMRAACAEGHTAEGYSKFNERTTHFHACCAALCSYGSLAEALPQLVLLFRSLSVAAVAADLNYWEAGSLPFADGNFGNIFQFIPGALIGAVHNCGACEATRDPALVEAREKLAAFCLSRLGQKKGSPKPEASNYADVETLVEESKDWRICYVRAAESLRVNPGGRGHHILHWAASHDPDPTVRAAAKEACATLRRQPALKAGSSPRRPLITALWWLFQAHRLKLGFPIDPIGIQETLAAFLRRTTERASSATVPPARVGWAWAGPPRFERL
jgi:hypothetical protein